jgi:hypothetical protein
MGAHSGGAAAGLLRRLPPEYDAAAAAFFLTGVAFKCPWTAISSLSQIAEQHGPRVLLLLNLAYFVPPMPLLALLSALQVGWGGGEEFWGFGVWSREGRGPGGVLRGRRWRVWAGVGPVCGAPPPP